MKNKRKIIFKLILILILIILFIKIFFLKGLINVEKIDDFLFLKLFSNGVYQKNSTQDDKYKKIYEFKINYKNLDFKSLNLSDTIDKNTLIYEKIGTQGQVEVLIFYYIQIKI